MEVGNIVFSHVVQKGYIKAAGQEVYREDYPALYQFALENELLLSEEEWANDRQGMYSFGDGNMSFRVPDLRGEFLRALDDGRGLDAERTLGSVQGDAMQTHLTQLNYEMMSGSSYACGHASGNVSLKKSGTPNTGVAIGGGSPQCNIFTLNYRRADETRPKNIALIAQIKY